MSNKREEMVEKTIDAYHESTGNLPDETYFPAIEEVVDAYLSETDD